MRRVLVIVIILLTTSLLCQSPSPHYQSALILQVKEHQGPVPGQGNDPTVTYDVTLRVKDTGTEYVVLYTPRPGVHGFQTMAGRDLLVLVESKTITFNDMLGRSTKVPILSQKPAPPPSKN